MPNGRRHRGISRAGFFGSRHASSDAQNRLKSAIRVDRWMDNDGQKISDACKRSGMTAGFRKSTQRAHMHHPYETQQAKQARYLSAANRYGDAYASPVRWLQTRSLSRVLTHARFESRYILHLPHRSTRRTPDSQQEQRMTGDELRCT